MHGVDVSFIGLNVIAFVKDLINQTMARRYVQEFIVGKQRSFPRSHVEEDHSTRLLARISEVSNGIPMFAAGLPGLLQAMPLNVIKPAVIETSEAAVFDSSVAEIGTAVGTMNS
jgi:hypothetical protein